MASLRLGRRVIDGILARVAQDNVAQDNAGTQSLLSRGRQRNVPTIKFP
jgi:hypothetical protein